MGAPTGIVMSVSKAAKFALASSRKAGRAEQATTRRLVRKVRGAPAGTGSLEGVGPGLVGASTTCQ